jgi:multisubunit Na+/H+ antiporter MnhB subunit
MMTSILLRTATRTLMPLLLLFALFLLLRGHNAPGGGFVGGLVVAAAFVLYAIAFDIPASRRALLVDPSILLGVGLLIALLSGLVAIFTEQPFMTAVWTSLGPESGGVLIGTPLLFDVGVFLAVIGVVLTIVFTLGDVALNED